MVMLQRWTLLWRENGSRYGGGQFILRSNDHVTEVVSFNGGRMVMLWRWRV